MKNQIIPSPPPISSPPRRKGRVRGAPERKFLCNLIIICLLAASTFLSVNAQEESATAKPNNQQQGEKPYPLNVSKGAPITSVLRQISSMFGVNIIPSQEVRGPVEEGHYEGYTIEELLENFLEAAGGYSYVWDGDRIKVFLIETPTKIFRLKYLDAYKVQRALQPQLSPRGTISVLSTSQPGWAFGTSGGTTGATGGGTGAGIGVISKRTRAAPGLERSNILIVSDVPSVLDRIEKIIYELDKKPMQILIEAKVVEVGTDDEARLGIQWRYLSPTDNPEEHNLDLTGLFPSTGEVAAISDRIPTEVEVDAEKIFNTGGTFTIGTLTAENYVAVLNALSQSKSAEILSSPRIMALDNQEASFLTGVQEPILKTETVTGQQTTQSVTLDQYISVGTQLLVIPQVAGDGYINMIIHPEVSEVTDRTDTIPSYPVIGTREADTQVLIKSGETVVIGGLVKNKKTKETAKVPLLGDIPLVGLLFRRSTDVNNKSELLIFITPHLVSEGENLAPASPATEPQSAPAAEVKLPPVQEPQPTAVESKPSVEAAVPPPVESEPKPTLEPQPVAAPQPAPVPEPLATPVSEAPPAAVEEEQPPPSVEAEPEPVPQAQPMPAVEVQPEPVAVEEPSPPVEIPPVAETPPAEPAPEIAPQQIDEAVAASAFKQSLDAIEKGDYNGASELLKRAIALNPNEPKYQEHLVRLQKTMEILGKE